MKKRILVLVCSIIVAASISACKNKGTESAATPSASPAPVAPATSQSTTLEVKDGIALTHGSMFLTDNTMLIVPNEIVKGAMLDLLDKPNVKFKLEGKYINCPPGENDGAKCFEVSTFTHSGESSQSTTQTQGSPGGQKIIFQTNSITYKKGISDTRCKELCAKVSEPVSDYMTQGWKVVSSTPRQQAVDNLCACDGVEYIISK